MIRKLCFIAAFAVASTLALALPSVQQVEAEVAQGRFAQAETMMAEVVAARPGSARAHYIYAEILARNERFARASEQARLARTIDPSLAFAGSADKFRTFEQLLERAQTGATARSSRAATPGAEALSPITGPARSTAAAPSAASGVPSWLWGVGLAVVAVLVWRAISRRSAAVGQGALAPGATAPAAMAPGAMAANSPYAPGAMPSGAMAPTARGGGLLGAGLAGAGGFAAGMMVDRMLHPDGGNRGADQLAGLGPDDTVRFDDPGTDLANRNVDFGSGGNDWGGDAGGASDAGGSDGGGGWDN